MKISIIKYDLLMLIFLTKTIDINIINKECSIKNISLTNNIINQKK